MVSFTLAITNGLTATITNATAGRAKGKGGPAKHSSRVRMRPAHCSAFCARLAVACAASRQSRARRAQRAGRP